MQLLVYQRVVQASVNEVNKEVGEDNEEWELEPVVPNSGAIGGEIIQLGVAKNFEQEERGGHNGNPGHSTDSLFDFHSDLVLEEFGMLKCCFIKYEDV